MLSQLAKTTTRVRVAIGITAFLLTATTIAGCASQQYNALASNHNEMVGMSDMSHSSSALSSADGSSQDVATGKTREYFIQSEEVDWSYAPTKKNQITNASFTDDEIVYARGADGKLGGTYKKCVYRGYADSSFKTQIEQPAYMGTLGPTIFAEVGDNVVVHFKNVCTFGTTIHVHGFLYHKDSEGAPYNDGTDQKGDDNVAPGTTYDYHYFVPGTAGPAAAEGSSAMWMYHSHQDEIGDVYAGLTGFIVVTRNGMADSQGKPTDVDQFVYSLYEIDNENASSNFKENFPGISDERVNDEGFHESNLKHSINGYIYGNGPMPVLKEGTRVRWLLMDMGNEVDVHTPHWHGNTEVVMGMRTDVVTMLSGTMITADLTPNNKGIWLFHCHVADHIAAGMISRYQVQ